MGSIVAVLKIINEHKEQIIFGLLLVAFVGFSVVQVKAKRNEEAEGENGKNPNDVIKFKPAPAREPAAYRVPSLTNVYPQERYQELTAGRDIFQVPEKMVAGKKPEEEEKWAEIRIKSVFDPTKSGNYIGIIEVDKRSRIVKEGDLFNEYEIQRIDGVRNCITIYWREAKSEDNTREFCKEE